MLTARAFAVLAGGAALWIGSRFVGSPELHIVAVGLLALVPLSMALVRWAPRDLHATRRLSTPRAFPGTRVRVDLEVENRGRFRTSFLLLEDRLPSALGPPARSVLPGVAADEREHVSYTIVCRARGRYPIGPLTISISDPFGLTRQRVRFSERQDLIVYPDVEELETVRGPAPPGGTGESTSRQLFRTGEDFYTMRSYEVGDDLRKIHWPSVARVGELMIRQEEIARRSSAAILLDTRRAALAGTSRAFERGISIAASIGNHYLGTGYTVRFATPDLAPAQLGRVELLEALALVEPSRSEVLTPALMRLRASAAGGAALVVVTHIPAPAEIAALSRAGSGFAKRIAVLVHMRDRSELAPKERSALAEGAEAARISLGHAGWDVIGLEPHELLEGRWRQRRRALRRIAASS